MGVFNIFGISKKDDDRPYPGYKLRVGIYKSVSGNSTSLSITMENGCIPLTAYIYSKYRVGDSKTISHTVKTNKSTAISSRQKGDASGDWYESLFNADLTQGLTLEEMQEITKVEATRSGFQWESFVLEITKWLEPIE